jgi:hypothetical protein
LGNPWCFDHSCWELFKYLGGNTPCALILKPQQTGWSIRDRCVGSPND